MQKETRNEIKTSANANIEETCYSNFRGGI